MVLECCQQEKLRYSVAVSFGRAFVLEMNTVKAALVFVSTRVAPFPYFINFRIKTEKEGKIWKK